MCWVFITSDAIRRTSIGAVSSTQVAKPTKRKFLQPYPALSRSHVSSYKFWQSPEIGWANLHEAPFSAVRTAGPPARKKLRAAATQGHTRIACGKALQSVAIRAPRVEICTPHTHMSLGVAIVGFLAIHVVGGPSVRSSHRCALCRL